MAGPLIESRDPVWWGLLHALGDAGIWYPWLNVLTSAVFFLGLHFFARRQPDPFGFLVLTFPLLIINLPMSGIRQGVAVGLMFFAFCAFVDRRVLRFVMITLAASTIHSSAIVFLALAPLVKRRFTASTLMLSALLLVPVAFVVLRGGVSQVALTRYVETDVDAQGAIFRLLLLFCTGAAFFLVLRKPWRQRFPGDYRLALLGSTMMIAVLALLPVSSVIADRYGYYLIPIQAMILSRIPYLPVGWYRGIYATTAYGVFVLTFAVWASLSQHFRGCYVEYQTWLFGLPPVSF